MRKEPVLSIGALLLAFLASQHHALHMLLLAAGLGGASASTMTAVPLVRRAMVVMSLAMVAVMAYQMRDARRPKSVRVMNAVSILGTLGLVAWSILQFGLYRRAGVAEPFRKDLTHLSWAEIYARQEKRAHLVSEWMDALHLKPGSRLLEVGAGPGYVSMILAARVGRSGVVYAVDKSAEALAYLERLQKERDLPQIRRIVADAAALEASGISVQAALITMVLHHAEDPVGILRSMARLLPPGGLAVVGEFDPNGPCEKGPPREHRIAPERIRSWCEAVGLAVLEERRQSPEHYMVLVQRPV